VVPGVISPATYLARTFQNGLANPESKVDYTYINVKVTSTAYIK